MMKDDDDEKSYPHCFLPYLTKSHMPAKNIAQSAYLFRDQI